MNEDDRLLKIVNDTLDILYEKENYLFINDLSERNMVFHFAFYFIEQLKNTEYENLSVDCEYNRNKLDERGFKEIIYDKKRHRIFPDLILHKRGFNDNNILAIEFKKANNSDRNGFKSDYYKLMALTDKNGEFKYHLGLFIVLGNKRNNVKITVYKNGLKKRL